VGGVATTFFLGFGLGFAPGFAALRGLSFGVGAAAATVWGVDWCGPGVQPLRRRKVSAVLAATMATAPICAAREPCPSAGSVGAGSASTVGGGGGGGGGDAA
jgi:hypothetical protein